MIIGIGTDMVDIRRMETVFSSPKRLEKCFTETEIQKAPTQDEARLAYIAKRFAAKEALAKALGCGFGEHLAFHDIEISNNERGKPEISLSGNGLAYLNSLCSENSATLHLSLSDEPPYAIAYVVVEAQ